MARALAIILSLVALHARAETVQRPLPDIVGARAAAMGDAYVGAPAGAPGYFHNPAALGLLRGVRLFVQTNVTGRESIEMDPKGIAYGWRRVGMAWGNRIAEDRRGIADYTHLSGGVALSSRVAVGVAAKFWRSHPWPRFQTVGGSATYDVGALVAGPAGWTFGARAGQLAKGEGPRAAAAGVWREGETYSLGAGAAVSSGDGASLRAGAEWRPLPRARLRVGFRGVAPTGGIGVTVGPADFDVAWTRYAGANLFIVGIAASLAR